jgi:hypothetical protein
MGKPQLYKGKTRQQIAQEALEKLGPEATRQQVDTYFGRYGITNGCEASMFWTERAALRRRMGLPVGVRENDKLELTMQDVQKVADYLKQPHTASSLICLKDTLDLIERIGAAKVRMAIDFIEEIKK